MRIFISAGEASGDLYASRLVEVLKARHPGTEFFGCAGPRMQAAGVRPIVDQRSLAVVGIIEVIPHIPRILGELKKLVRACAAEPPDVAVLTDSPSFHLPLARKLKRQGVPIVYLVAPQAWAWKQGRVKTMRATLARLLCIFPFEEEFFQKHAVPAVYIGHPLSRLAKPKLTRAEFCSKLGIPEVSRIVALLPGSRHGELARHLPVLLESIRLIRRRQPVTFVLPLPAGFGLQNTRFWEPVQAESIKVIEGHTWDALAQAELALAASGTVTIEGAMLGAPMVTFYRVNALSWYLQRWRVRTPFLTMVNLVAGRQVVPELIQDQMTSERIAAEALRLFEDVDAMQTMRAGLAEVAGKLGSERDPMEIAADWVESANSVRVKVEKRFMPVKFLGSMALAATLVVQGHAQGFGPAQAQRPRVDVDNYTIDAQVDPNAQTIRATAKVSFTPLDDATSLSFELNNALSLDSVTDGAGRQVPASRVAQDMSVRLSLAETLPKGKPATLTFVYGGKLTGAEESPVWGIKFAAIHPDFAYFMYPGRWFPVNDYTADRFTADLKVTVPSGYKVIGSGIQTADLAADGKTAVRFQLTTPSFPGSFAIVKGDPTVIASGGMNTALYFRERKDMAGAYGQEIGRAMEFLTGVFGPLPSGNLIAIETEAGTPNGYSAPGILFLSPRAIGSEVNAKLLANQIAQQWWGAQVSPSSRNHLWIQNGMARYAELLYTENISGAGAMEDQVRNDYVEALTVEQPPLIQSARLEDYSPEFWAATAGKGAAVLHMLRTILGDENFFKLLKAVPERYAGKSINTADFQKMAEEVSGQSLNYFFLQWIESSGAPEFKMEWTMFRVGSKGFRVNGKISQDLDTFRMPVTLRIDTEGNPEEKKIEVAGTSTDFAVETFGKPKNVVLDPKGQLLRYDNDMRVAVAIKRGEQFMEVSEYVEALNEYKKALDVKRNSSLAHYRTADAYFLQGNYQAAANEYREALSGDVEPKWTEVWAHINLGKIYDITDQRERAVNEYKLAQRTKDNTQGALEEAQKYINAKFERPRNTNN